jgi:GNAT superfamily N-acetyltransferase
MNMQDVTRRILDQRLQRYPTVIPGLNGLGTAPFRLDGLRIQVAFASARPGRGAQLVSAVLGYCATRRYHLLWHVIPQRPGESELGPALTGLGVHESESQRLMVHAGPITVMPNPRVVVVPITSLEAMVTYEEGSRVAFFDDPYPVTALVDRRARERLYEQERGWCRYFATHLDGLPVGGCYYTLYEDIPTIMGVYTTALARNQGVASTLLAHVVNQMLAAGVSRCCLYVRLGNPAERLYRLLGFVPLLDEHTYESNPARS